MKTLINAIKILLFLTITCGIIYPLVITTVAQLLFPNMANGSLIIRNNKIVGSELIGQEFTDPAYFSGRPSAIANNPMPSGGSNLTPLGNSFKKQFKSRIDTIKKYHNIINTNAIPKDLLFSSASGVDPDISPEAAYFQVNRICQYRKLNNNQKQVLIDYITNNIEHSSFNILGEDRIKVLNLNLYLKGLNK